jgi:hypothetical protein
LVRPGSPDAVPGLLSLVHGILRFAGDDVSLDVPNSEVRRARRRRGSPILEVSYGEDHTVFLYFAEPPPLPGANPRPGLGGKGIERAASALHLGAESRLLRRTIDEWAEALRGAGER